MGPIDKRIAGAHSGSPAAWALVPNSDFFSGKLAARKRKGGPLRFRAANFPDKKSELGTRAQAAGPPECAPANGS